jgi:uncharacterized protein
MRARTLPGIALCACVVTAAAIAGCERRLPQPASTAEVGVVPEAPEIDRPVVDQTALLSAADVEHLSSHLLLLRERTGVQMAVLLVASTGEEPIEDFSMRVAEAWAGGAADRDDGLLLTMAMVDRRMRLEVGYGLEERITDAEAQVIVDGMRDDLRAGATAHAIEGAIDAVARELPATSPSVLHGPGIAHPSGFAAGVPFTLTALLCVLGFLVARGKPTAGRKRKARGQTEIARERRAWAGLAAATIVIAVLFSWLYAGLTGPATDAPIAFLGSVAILLGAGWPLDRHARKHETPFARWGTFGSLMLLVVLVTLGLAGSYLGASEALAFVAGAFMLSLVLLPVLLADGSGSSSSYSGSSSSSSSSYGSSSSSSYSSSSSSSSSSSYSGGGGGFGGGGASSSW